MKRLCLNKLDKGIVNAVISRVWENERKLSFPQDQKYEYETLLKLKLQDKPVPNLRIQLDGFLTAAVIAAAWQAKTLVIVFRSNTIHNKLARHAEKERELLFTRKATIFQSVFMNPPTALLFERPHARKWSQSVMMALKAGGTGEMLQNFGHEKFKKERILRCVEKYVAWVVRITGNDWEMAI